MSNLYGRQFQPWSRVGLGGAGEKSFLGIVEWPQGRWIDRTGRKVRGLGFEETLTEYKLQIERNGKRWLSGPWTLGVLLVLSASK